MINLNQFRAFYYVAKHLSYTLAAEKLFISQPAVTAQVKLFEATYDIKLFKRYHRFLQLTHEGKLLFEKAKEIFTRSKIVTPSAIISKGFFFFHKKEKFDDCLQMPTLWRKS